MKTVQMPKWVAVCLALSVLASLCLAALALTSYTLVKPFMVSISTAPCPLTVQSLSFAYDPTLNQYTQCNMQISSSGGSVSATVYVYLRNSTQQTIAQGQLTQTFASGTTSLTVPLTWVQGETTDDVAGGYVVVQPT
ncbi:MAG: hypothetical protein ACPLZY_02150 [Candidatus Norongarragalinales archaeon]